jgi:hypothetical protein
MIGRGFRRSNVTPVVCCAWTDSAACFTSDDDDSDFCSIASDMLRFFKIGFLTPSTNELVLDNLLAGSEFCDELNRFDAGCIGPYSHVTSTSFSLRDLLVRVEGVKIKEWRARMGMIGGNDRGKIGGFPTHQFSVSGDTVLSLNWDLAHVRQEAFSSRDRSPYTFRCSTMCRHDDHMSSSRQSYER